jgi:ABC-type nickel/cobalt efflux system permease component RcnA
MTELLTFATAFLLGFVHAVDVDHAVAVSAFVSSRPSIPVAARFGLRWALGHSVAVLAAGGLLLALGLRWSAPLELWAERLVGTALIAVGLWALRSSRDLHYHPPATHGDHAHLHLHRASPPTHEHPHHSPLASPRHHPRGIAVVGLVHGLAGTTALLALVPVGMMGHPLLGLSYLLCFCLGVTAGMILFASLVAVALTRANAHSVEWGRRAARAVALASLAVGLVWSLIAWSPRPTP